MSGTRQHRASTKETGGSRSPQSLRSSISVAQVCEELGVSRSTFYDWRAKRKGPACFRLPNGDLRVACDDYEAWLSSLERDAA